MNKRDLLYSLMFFYLGFSLFYFSHLSFDNWRWWVISAPLWIIVSYQEAKIEKR